MKIYNKNVILIKNKYKIIRCIFLVTPVEMDNCYLLNLNIDYLNGLLIVGCFLLGNIVIVILLMADNSRSNDLSFTHNVIKESNNSSYDLTGKLVAQLLYNNANITQAKTYLNFPSDHPGHLDLERRIRFVSIIRSSNIAHKYRFGSSLGNLYIKNTYHHPVINAEMIGVVLAAEST